MGLGENLKSFLAPLGVYDLDIGAGATELEAVGEIMDSAEGEADALYRESNIITATDYGIDAYEELFPFGSVLSTLESRKKAIIGLIRMDGMSFTLSDMNRIINGCGIRAEISETNQQFVVNVTFPETHGIPGNIAAIQSRINKILPSHISAVYVYTYPTWSRIEQIGAWSNIEQYSWDALERLS